MRMICREKWSTTDPLIALHFDAFDGRIPWEVEVRPLRGGGEIRTDGQQRCCVVVSRVIQPVTGLVDVADAGRHFVEALDRMEAGLTYVVEWYDPRQSLRLGCLKLGKLNVSVEVLP